MNKTNNQEFLIENIISEVLMYLVEDRKISMEQALREFYRTSISSKLEDEETEYYLEGAAYIYEQVKKELEEKKG